MPAHWLTTYFNYYRAKRRFPAPRWMKLEDLIKFWQDLKALGRDILTFMIEAPHRRAYYKPKLPQLPYTKAKRDKKHQKLSKLVIHKSSTGLRYTIKRVRSTSVYPSKEQHHDLANAPALYHGLQNLEDLDPGLCPPLDVLTHALEEVRSRSRRLNHESRTTISQTASSSFVRLHLLSSHHPPKHSNRSLPPSQSSDEVIWDIDLSSKRRWLSKHRHLVPFVVHAILIILYTTVFAVVYSNFKTAGGNVDELGIPYVKQVFEVNPALNESVARIYTGEPSEELDAAWERLHKYSNIRVPEEEIRRLGRLDESVRFTDGSGYFGQMTMFHHLHCIMRVHHFLHVERYCPNATADDMYLLRAHNFHCLDTLRQAVMCQGDTSLITFRWGDTQPIPLGNFSSEHRCKSWDALDAWNKEHFVDVFQPGLVVHPKLGPAYGGESGTHGTGVVVEQGEVKDGMGIKVESRAAHHKGVEDANVDSVRVKEEMELAWSGEKRGENGDEEEGRKGKVAAKLSWRRDAKPPTEANKRLPSLPWKREAKPPAKVSRAQAPDKWEDPLPPIDW